MDSPRRNPRDLKDQKPTPSPSTSPNSSSSSSTSSATNGTLLAPPPTSSSLPPLTPKSNPNPNPNPNPTTFIQADTQSFKQVVQMLTGSADTTAKRSAQAQTQTNSTNSNFAPGHPQKSQIPPINRPTKKPAFKLYERRSSMKNLKMISPLIPSFPNCPSSSAAAASFSPRQPEILSPSILDFPKLVLSPVTPLSPDPFSRLPSQLGISPEERAIAEKGFYLHPSPRDAQPPKLLPLFPLSSPRMGSSAAAAAAES